MQIFDHIENEAAEDEFTRLLDKEVKNARLNEEWRSEYLKTYVNDMDMKREGYLEGEERGKIEGEKLGLERGRSEGEKLGRNAREQELLQNLMNTMHLTETEARDFP